MAYTQSDIDALKAAIAAQQGAQEVRFNDRRVVYRSLDDLKKLLQIMERDVAAAASTPSTRLGVVCKGV